MTQTVLITGAASGLGAATAVRFARQGWNVIAAMRRVDAGSQASQTANTLVAHLDVQDATSIEAAITAGIAAFGHIDVVVNNAGYGLFGIFEATPPGKWREQCEVNVFGVMAVTRAILPHFRSRRVGLILNVSSGAGVFTLPMISLYCASKFALEGYSEALTYELAPLGQLEVPADYDPVVASTNAVFARLRGQPLSTQEEVAAAIFAAATDGSDQLRYVVGDDIRPLVHARRESSEQQYIALMRARFTTASPAR